VGLPHSLHTPQRCKRDVAVGHCDRQLIPSGQRELSAYLGGDDDATKAVKRSCWSVLIAPGSKRCGVDRSSHCCRPNVSIARARNAVAGSVVGVWNADVIQPDL
jgi:hypothetical protein